MAETVTSDHLRNRATACEDVYGFPPADFSRHPPAGARLGASVLLA